MTQRIILVGLVLLLAAGGAAYLFFPEETTSLIMGRTVETPLETVQQKKEPAKPDSGNDVLLEDAEAFAKTQVLSSGKGADEDDLLFEEEPPPSKTTGDSTTDPSKKTRSVPKIAQLTPKILEQAHKEKYKKRPKPTDFDFKGNKEIARYLNSIQDEVTRKREQRRLDFIQEVREGVIRLTDRNHYTGVIQMKNSKSTGTIAMVNRNGMVVQTGRQRFGGKEQKWNTFSPQQLPRMLEFFGDQRAKLEIAGKSKKELQADAADEFFAAALFLEWYGEYGESIRLLNKAIKANPAVESLAEKLFLDI